MLVPRILFAATTPVGPEAWICAISAAVHRLYEVGIPPVINAINNDRMRPAQRENAALQYTTPEARADPDIGPPGLKVRRVSTSRFLKRTVIRKMRRDFNVSTKELKNEIYWLNYGTK